MVLFVGGLIPFLWVIPLGWWLWRRRTGAVLPATPAPPATVPPLEG
jgi:hypothetical protein